jgi:hypothetical protein
LKEGQGQGSSQESASKHYPKFHKPVLLRLDFTLILHKTRNYPSVKEIADEIAHLSFSVSSICRHEFTINTLSEMISHNYYLLNSRKSDPSPVTVSQLIEQVKNSPLFRL